MVLFSARASLDRRALATWNVVGRYVPTLWLAFVAVVSLSCGGGIGGGLVGPDAEARVQAQWFTDKTITKCGDSYYYWNDEREGWISEFKGMQVWTSPRGLSDADRLNGYEWRGEAGVNCSVWRLYTTPRGWSKWMDCATATQELRLHKLNGRWYYEDIGRMGQNLPAEQYAPHKVACQQVAP